MSVNRHCEASPFRPPVGRSWPHIGAVVTVLAALLLVACACTATPASPAPAITASGATPTGRAATEMPTAPASPTARTPTASPEPTLTPTPTPSPPTAEPTIHTFEADVEIADPGDTITLSWRWSGADAATIYHLLPSGQLSEPYWQVEPSGSRRYTISPDRRNHDSFVLFLSNAEEGVVDQSTVQVRLRCPDDWFFTPSPDVCPAAPATETDGAEQHFERGTMVWNRAEGVIYILFEDDRYPRWTAYADEWEEGEPVSDPNIHPPAGLLQPIRGFGLVWRENPTVRERLGWAVDRERGYSTAIQRTSHFRYRDIYVRALDGGVWRLGPNGGDWEHIATGEE